MVDLRTEKFSKLINHFLQWYEGSSHKELESLYRDEVTNDNLSSMSEEDFFDFVERFAKEGGGVQTGGARTAPKLMDSVRQNPEEFKSRMLQPFKTGFNEKEWLAWTEGFPYLGKGTATIYLNRVDPKKYVIVNNKSTQAFTDLGFEIKTNSLVNEYESLHKAESSLRSSYPVLRNYFVVDAFTHFLVGTEEGKKAFLEYTGMEDRNIRKNRSYWRIGTTEDEESRWEFMKTSKVASIGWSDIGDLNEIEINNKKDIENQLRKVGYQYPNNVFSRKAGEIFNFYNEIKGGDIVLAQDGANVLSIGIVKGKYQFIRSDPFAHQRKVKWLVHDPTLINKEGLRTTVYKLKNSAFLNQVDRLLEPSSALESTLFNMKQAPNQILYGPPGTGKTYHTINKAIKICNPDFDLEQDRSIIKTEYERLVKSGQVVFTTFHQSLSYEDFIEGLKPLKPEEGDEFVKYEVVPGTFRKLCVEAAFSIAKSKLSEETEEILDFSLAYDSFIEQVEEKLSTGEVKLKTKTGGEVLVDSVSDRGNLIIKHLDGTRSYTVSKNRLTKLNAAIKDLDDVSNINDQFREIIGGSNSTAYWTALNAIRQSVEPNRAPSKDRVYSFDEKYEVVRKLTKEEYRSSEGSPHVLIVDEINRGNVSEIFGELITLLEEDKRAGKDEALEVTLPYSREKFSVPPNLYVIGTMNTADRSVEALDNALRRRFSFTHVAPNPELLSSPRIIWNFWWKYFDLEWDNPDFKKYEADLYAMIGIGKELEGKKKGIWDNWEEQKVQSQITDLEGFTFPGISLEELLKAMNERISYLKDDDHQIGHSYFMNVFSLLDLKEAFKKNIIPLLQEYFFNDYEKIRWILGDEFVELVKQPKFAVSNTDVIEQDRYRLMELNDDFDILKAVRNTINPGEKE